VTGDGPGDRVAAFGLDVRVINRIIARVGSRLLRWVALEQRDAVVETSDSAALCDALFRLFDGRHDPAFSMQLMVLLCSAPLIPPALLLGKLGEYADGDHLTDAAIAVVLDCLAPRGPEHWTEEAPEVREAVGRFRVRFPSLDPECAAIERALDRRAARHKAGEPEGPA